MPVKMEVHIVKGWKNEQNERFGPCVEVWFVNTADGKAMFKYAPNLIDKDFWEQLFSKLGSYDDAVKELRNLNSRGVAGGCWALPSPNDGKGDKG